MFPMYLKILVSEGDYRSGYSVTFFEKILSAQDLTEERFQKYKIIKRYSDDIVKSLLAGEDFNCTEDIWNSLHFFIFDEEQFNRAVARKAQDEIDAEEYAMKQKAKREKEEAYRKQLIASAKSKLTPEEIKALGI